MTDVKFVRIRGRIVPIKKKQKDHSYNPKKGATKVAIGTVVGVVGSTSASKSLKESFRLYRKSAEMRAISRLAEKGSKTANSFIRLAAKSKISAIKKTNISRTKFGVAIGVTSAILGSGISDFFDKKSKIKDEVSAISGTVGSALVVGLAARRFGIKASGINELFTGFAAQGRKLSRSKITRVSLTRFNKNRPKRGTQMKFDI